jgi:hypothetical protein
MNRTVSLSYAQAATSLLASVRDFVASLHCVEIADVLQADGERFG